VTQRVKFSVEAHVGGLNQTFLATKGAFSRRVLNYKFKSNAFNKPSAAPWKHEAHITYAKKEAFLQKAC
jgi:hypothetical protein